MSESNAIAEKVAENKIRSERNSSDIRDIVFEIRKLPAQIKNAIKEEFANHQLLHEQIDDRDKKREIEIDDLIMRMEKVEILVIKFKANWKILVTGFSCVVAGLVWAIQQGVAALFL